MSILECKKLIAKYGDFQALYGIDFYLDEGETVCIIGSNGAGKSTFLKSLTGLVSVENDSISLNDKNIGGFSADDIAKLGIAMVPEGRRLFPSLSVEENLLIGKESKRDGEWNLEKVYEIFPILKERRLSPGTALSGGQQQMVAIGRALMSNPKILLCDEISLGLAPVIVKDIYAIFPQIKKQGISIVIVEQDINQAMKVSDRVYCFQEGRVSLEGKPNELTHDEISKAYFGV
jgi:branched-chain amino acid transport system ATP-binding protein